MNHDDRFDSDAPIPGEVKPAKARPYWDRPYVDPGAVTAEEIEADMARLFPEKQKAPAKAGRINGPLSEGHFGTDSEQSKEQG